METILTIHGKKELIKEFKENFEIHLRQTGEKALIVKEIDIKKLKKEWTKRILNKSGIIYQYIQKELVDSFIKDLEDLLKCQNST